jgi:LysM repeat protein
MGLLVWVGWGLPRPVLLAQEETPASHEVRAGETLSEIAAAYGVSMAELMALNGIGNANHIRVGDELLLPESAIHIGGSPLELPTHEVRAGETLSEIAKEYGISQARLMMLNGLENADAIIAGQVLRLPALASDAAAIEPVTPSPPPQTVPAETPPVEATPAPTEPPTEPSNTVERPSSHIVQRGETLSEIAQAYGIPMRALMAANAIQNADAIVIGQELRIPPAPTATPEATPTSTPSPTDAPVSDEPVATATNDDTVEADGTAIIAASPFVANIASLNRTYTVRTNDTLERIARRLGVDSEALRRINRLRVNSKLTEGATLIVPATADDIRVLRPGQEYVVQPGDSLGVIAKSFGLSLADLMQANYIGNPDTIATGQRLLIPETRPEESEEGDKLLRIGPPRSGYLYYTVQTGDTLSALAEQFDSTMLALLDYNGLPNMETVFRGLELRIPYGPPPLPVRLPPVPTSGVSFMVSLSRQECWLFWGKEMHRRWRCSTGYGEFVTRTGAFAVQSKIENAKSNAYRLDMPYWLGIYNVGKYENGIHGLPVSWETGKKIWTTLIGQPATFGCAMLADEDAAELFAAAYIGMPVYVID